MTYYSTTTWQPTGDYRLDWDLTGDDGGASLVSATGNPNIAVDVATPENSDGDDYDLSGGKLVSSDVQNQTTATIDFGTPVTDVNFQIQDVDQDGGYLSDCWDDKVTILAYDENGDLVDVDFNIQSGSGISENGNTIEGGANPDDDYHDDGTTDNVTVSIAGPIVKLVIIHDNGSSAEESGEIKVTDLGFNGVFEPEVTQDGIVSNDDDGDLIDETYDGDPDGDFVDNNDAILPGEVGDDDIIDARGGDDTILAGAGDDEVYAGAGDDYVEGGAGDDLIRGDSELGGAASSTEGAREVFQWDEAPNYGDEVNADSSFTQNTGTTNVTYSVYYEKNDADIEFEDDAGNVSGIDTGSLGAADQNSGLALEGDGKYDDAKVKLEFDQDVTDVSFRINDVDMDSTVTVYAFVDGQAVEVDLSGGSAVNISGDTATSTGGDEGATEDQNSVLVNIAGPVDTIYVKHDIIDHDTSHVQLTDVYFNSGTVVDDDDDCDLPESAGNDELHGGDGEDTIYGEGGDDIITGGADNDTLYGDHGLASEATPTETVRESLNWNEGVSGSNATGFVQNTGNVDVEFKIVSQDSGMSAMYANDEQNVSGIDTGDETINANQSFFSATNSDPNREGTYELSFSDEVTNVDFRINDVDGDGVVQVKAYDADGNPIEVSLTGGAKVTLLDSDTVPGADTIDSQGGYEDDTSDNYSTLVEIAGPVARIEISHTQDGPNNSGINVTDVFFDVAVGADEDCCPEDEGNDTIDGGEGDDLIYGNGGDDVLIGGAGQDTIYGDQGTSVTGGGYATGDLIENGSFENTDGMTGTSYGYVGTGSVVGWKVVDPTGEFDFHNDGRHGVDPSDGENWLDLEESPGNIQIYQDVQNVVEGEEYTLSFDAADSAYLDDNTFDVFWGGELVASIDPSAGTMEEYIFTVVGGAGDGSDRLLFVGHGNGDDYTGASIDNVQLVGSIDGTLCDPNEGNDTITGGEGADVMYGEGGDDTFLVGSSSEGDGDTISGGNGPDENTDWDVLDLRGSGRVTIDKTDDATDAQAFTGTVTFSDGKTLTFNQIEEIITDPQNEGPDAVDDQASIDEDGGSVNIPVLANDNDPDGDPIQIVSSTTPSNGSVVDNGDGTFTYTPEADFYGTDTFTYTISDGTETDTATVTVTVNSVNDAPDAVDDTASGDEDDAVITIDVLDNDSDPDGDTLTVTGTGTPSHGTVTINANGTLDYTPEADFNGTDVFTYTISDGNGGTDTASVTVTVNEGEPDNSVNAVDDLLDIDEDSSIIVDLTDNDSDPEGDDFSVKSVNDPTNGTATLLPDGTVQYTPDPDFFGTDSFTYVLEDELGATDIATVTVNVDPVNDAPDAEDDVVVTDENDPTVIDVLDNDSDPDGDPLEVLDVSDPGNGTVTENPDGTLTYTPDAGFTGTDTFTYVVSDGEATDTASVTVVVNPQDDCDNEVVAVNDSYKIDPDVESITIDVLENDFDPEGDDFAVDSVGTPTNGTATLLPDGTIEYTPNDGYSGTDTFTYVIKDEFGATDTATVTIEVCMDMDLPPVANDDTARTPIETPIVLPVLANDYDPDGDDANLDVIGLVSPDGTAEISPDGQTITFTPADDFTGPTTITYMIMDEDGLTDTAEVTVMVNDGIVEGTEGNDVIDTSYTGDPEGDMVDAEDSIFDPVGSEDDIIEGYGGDDEIDGGNGNDHIDGGDGDDNIDGGDGDDTIIGGAGSDTVNGGDGDDYIDTSGPDPKSDHGFLPGETVDNWPLDPLTPYDLVPVDDDPNDDKDVVDGGAGDDIIITGDDADVIDGGSGNDWIDGGLDDDDIDGGTGNDFIIGGHGSDDIDGGDGDDEIWGGLGPDASDILNIEDDANPVDDYGDEDDNDPTSPVPTFLDPRPGNGIDYIHGGKGNDKIYGQDDDDVLFGDEGDDYIDGGIDDDMIFGGLGSDVLIGGKGNDHLDGGDNILPGVENDGVDEADGGDDRDTFVNFGPNDFIDGGEGGDDWDTLNLIGSAPTGGSLKVDLSDDNPENGTVQFFDQDGKSVGTMDFINIEEIVPCFTPGTLIATPRGEVPVESLREGDRVITRDNGIQEIRWIGHKSMDWKSLNRSQHLKPVLIKAGSLGNGLPERDMMVSPNHRMLVANDQTSLYFDEREVLASAKHLVDSNGIMTVDVKDVTYIHFLFDHHEVVLSDGTWSESFQPGDYSLKGIGNAQRQELFELFPELETREGIEDFTAARRILKKHEAQMLARGLKK